MIIIISSISLRLTPQNQTKIRPPAQSVPYLKSLSCSLRCNASFPASTAPASFERILSSLFISSATASSSSEQKARSAFQLAKWEALSCLSERIFKGPGAEHTSRSLASETCTTAFDDIQNCNEDVIPHLFNVSFNASTFLTTCSPPPTAPQLQEIITGLWKTGEKKYHVIVDNAIALSLF